jgi:hypothetical protein
MGYQTLASHIPDKSFVLNFPLATLNYSHAVCLPAQKLSGKIAN